MHLKGNLETSFLASILQLLCNENKTGILQLNNNDDEVRIFIKDGKIIYVTGSRRETRLGNILRSEGIITSQQLLECLELAEKSGQALGKILVDNGWISRETLKRMICKQAEDFIFNVFLWQKGTFEYKDAEFNLKNMVITPLNVLNIILEASRRIDEMSILVKRISSDQLTFKISEAIQDKKEIKFNANEWRILSLIDGRRTVRKLIEESGFDDFAAYKVLYSFISYGLIKPVISDIQSSGPKNSDKFYAIIKAYDGILRIIIKNLEIELRKWPFTIIDQSNPKVQSPKRETIESYRERELGQWVFSIIDECKSALSPRSKNLLENFKPNYPGAENIRNVSRFMMKNFKNFESDRIFIINSFNEFIESIFRKSAKILGIHPTRQAMQKIEKILNHIRNDQKDSSEKNDMVKGLVNIFKNIENEMEKHPEGFHKSRGIFAISS
jgi:hypothetical protein